MTDDIYRELERKAEEAFGDPVSWSLLRRASAEVRERIGTIRLAEILRALASEEAQRAIGACKRAMGRPKEKP